MARLSPLELSRVASIFKKALQLSQEALTRGIGNPWCGPPFSAMFTLAGANMVGRSVVQDPRAHHVGMPSGRCFLGHIDSHMVGTLMVHMVLQLCDRSVDHSDIPSSRGVRSSFNSNWRAPMTIHGIVECLSHSVEVVSGLLIGRRFGSCST